VAAPLKIRSLSSASETRFVLQSLLREQPDQAFAPEAGGGILSSQGKPVEQRPQAGAGPTSSLANPRLSTLFPCSSRKFFRHAILLRPSLLIAEPVQ
jgi:hypothetical protein